MKTKKPKKIKLPTIEDKREDYPHRLADLEKELRTYPAKAAGERLLTSVHDPEDHVIAKEKVVSFKFGSKPYSIGHLDGFYAASNHARGVRTITLYLANVAVLCIEGDVENQQFGSNFRFQSIKTFTPGEWEADFSKLTDDLIHLKEKRRQAFQKKRASQKSHH